MTGQTIAHYKIADRIGAGGMGEVYRATDSKLHRDVAIKVISKDFASDPERMARFEREAQVLASLTHGSIAAVYGIEDAGDSRAIIMELVEGEDLSDRLRRGPLPVDEALRTAVHIAEALETAHDKGVIHRDLKPGNIKLLPSGGVKLLDFGLAKALDDAGPAHLTKGDAATLSVAATRAGIVLGTAAYMSPEQATGTPADRRSDIWSFGVVLFEMLTGQRLFDGQTTSHVLADVIRAEIDFNRLPANTPPELRTLIERALERDPRRRLRDIHDARLILERLLERGTGSHSVLRSGAVPAMLAPAPRPRDWMKWGLAAIALAAVALAMAGWMRPAAPQPPQMKLTARVADLPFFENSPGPAFDLSPDGTQIAMVIGPAPDRRVPRLVVRRLNELDSTTLVDPGDDSPTAEQPYNPFFSPDGAWVGYVTPGELKKVPTIGGTPMTIARIDRSRGASWGADGTIVIAPTAESGLARVSAAGGELQPLTTLDESAGEVSHRWPQILPGGRAALFTSIGTNLDEAVIEAVTLETGERTVVLRGGTYGRYVSSGHLVYLQQNTLFVVPFDAKGLKVTGAAAPVVPNVLAASANSPQGAAHFAFAAETGLMAYRQGINEVSTHEIAWVDRAGRTTTLLAEHGTYVNPRLSPDGKRLSLTTLRNRNWDVWVYDLDRRVSTRVTFDDGIESEQVWSPDGRELAYTTDEPDGSFGLYRKAADGSGAATLILKSKTGLWTQDWTPDGQRLVVVGADNSNDIGIVSLTEPNPTVEWILNSRFLEADPAVSPDGRLLAYTSNESGRVEVYVRQFPSGSGRWQVSSGGGAYPRWSSDGRELFYRTNTGLMVASMERAGEGLHTGRPESLLNGQFLGGSEGLQVGSLVFADYDAAADGSKFVMFPKAVAEEGAAAGMLVLVSNWFHDLALATGSQ